jgi:hypothetical protein
MAEVEQWASAADDLLKEELTEDEQERIEEMLKSCRSVDAKAGVSPEEARERYARAIRKGRHQDFSDF